MNLLSELAVHSTPFQLAVASTRSSRVMKKRRSNEKRQLSFQLVKQLEPWHHLLLSYFSP